MAKHTGTRNERMLAWGAAGLLLCGASACGDKNRQGADRIGDPGQVSDKPRSPAPGTMEGPNPLQGPPPPISGGTLLVTQDDTTAVAADPDRDSVWLVNLPTQEVRSRVRLASGSEPGRVLEDQDGKLHVVLRRAGQLAKIDPWTGAVLSTRAVCPAPRGLAYDRSNDNLYVACAGGELITLKARGGDVPRQWYIDSDLRDVAVAGSHLLVTRFRSAEVIEVDAAGSLVGRAAPRKTSNPLMRDSMGQPITASPTTAWRMVGFPDGQVVVLHQRGQDNPVSTKHGGYSTGSCFGSSIVSSALTVFNGTQVGGGATISSLVLPVDVAVSSDGQQLAMISPAALPELGSAHVQVLTRASLTPSDGCSTLVTSSGLLPADAQPIAGAYDGKGQLWVQTRNPARIYQLPSTQSIPLTGAEDRSDDGHRLFHTPTSGFIACASCHAEAGEDGHVWTFEGVGPRRTPSLRGGLLATAPFHWDGDLSNMSSLMQEVFTGRMSGQSLSLTQVGAVGTWLDAQPLLPKSAALDPQAVARGQALFSDAKVGCTSCHYGPHLTNNATVDVGTGKPFQVPSLLGLAARAPYLHSGCAPSLISRFDGSCGGGDRHGQTSQLAPAQLLDLVAYLQTL